MCFKMRTANTSYIIRNLGFGREQKLHCLTLQFQSRSPSKKPTDFSFSVFSRTEGQSDFSKICFSNWPLKLTHAKLRHSAVIWNWENVWLSILVCKENLIGTFKNVLFGPCFLLCLMFILHKHYVLEHCVFQGWT